MSRGPLYDSGYRPQFSGHETFPLRYGWLKKAYDAVQNYGSDPDKRSIFLRDDAIAKLGVGRNMVSSIRHWASAVGVIADSEYGKIVSGEIGELLFGREGQPGLDPYLENPASLWLIHWQLCGRGNKTTWFWVFNHYPGFRFDRHQLVEGLERLGSELNWGNVSTATIKRDVECFVRSYVTHVPTAKSSPEDSLESPLAELGLIKAVGKRDGFRLIYGSKPSLGTGVFLYAITYFWLHSDYRSLNHLPFDVIARAPGSPGRVFLLDENDLADRLLGIEDSSGGTFSWSETSGIKGIIRNPKKQVPTRPLDYLFADMK